MGNVSKSIIFNQPKNNSSAVIFEENDKIIGIRSVDVHTHGQIFVPCLYI